MTFTGFGLRSYSAAVVVAEIIVAGNFATRNSSNLILTTLFTVIAAATILCFCRLFALFAAIGTQVAKSKNSDNLN